LHFDDSIRTADESTQKALGPLAVLILDNHTATADERMQKALGPLAVAALRETSGLPRLTGAERP